MARRKTKPMPSGWQPRQQDIDALKASRPTVDVPAFTAHFMDAAQQYEYADWDAAYRTWGRSDITRRQFTYPPEVFETMELAKRLGRELPEGWQKDVHKWRDALKYTERQEAATNRENVTALKDRLKGIGRA